MAETNGITATDAAIRFFGRITASVSHEIKNALAIINENAGLIEDLTVMAGKNGTPLDTDRIGAISARIGRQIHRTDDIIKRLNAFAHSADENDKWIDVGETLALLTDLTARLAAMRQVTVNLNPPDGKISVKTHPFLFETLVFSCLLFSMDSASPNDSIEVCLAEEEKAVSIRFGNLKALSGKTGAETFPGPETETLLSALKADARVFHDRGEIELLVPKETGIA